ncbi:MAG: hypothetical protein ACOC4C_05100 [Fibrobacterota bacterium]
MKLACSRIFNAGIVLLIPATFVFAQQDDIKAEITRIRKELMQVQEERERVVEEKKKDAEDFENYRKRMRTRMRTVRLETDSVKNEIVAYKFKNDSLSSLINAQKARKKHFELRQESLRGRIMASTDLVLSLAQSYPPSAGSKTISAAKLLKNDLSTKSIDNVEAISRLFQIIRGMQDESGIIQIVQGSSPLPEIRGTTYRLRLGTIFEAVVNTEGTKAALWSGRSDNGDYRWELIDNAVTASQILKAVNVREGKEVPELVELPLQHVRVQDGNSTVELKEESSEE